MALIKCDECGKEFSNTLEACPHCGFRGNVTSANESSKQHTGYVQQNSYIPQDNNEKQKVDAFCLAGGIVALCSIILDFFGLVAITGIVLSALGLERIKTTGANGKSWAITGIVVGIIEAVFKFLQLISLMAW